MRRLVTVIIAIMLIGVAAFSAVAAGISLTLKSSMPVEEQAAALEEYIAKLPEDQRQAWFDELDALANDRKTVYSLMEQDAEEDIVFIADTGKRYHQDKNCRGLNSARNISAVTKEVALAMDRTPCKICYPNGDSK